MFDKAMWLFLAHASFVVAGIATLAAYSTGSVPSFIGACVACYICDQSFKAAAE